MTDKTTADLLAEAVALIKERHQDMAARRLREWDGQPSILVIEEPVTGPETLKALEFVKRYGRKAGVRLCKPVEVAHPGTPAKDDPQVNAAMSVWDYLNDAERRETFRTVYRHILAYKQTRDLNHLLRGAESVDLMIRLDSAHPERRDQIRDATGPRWMTLADPAEVEALIRLLKGQASESGEEAS